MDGSQRPPTGPFTSEPPPPRKPHLVHGKPHRFTKAPHESPPSRPAIEGFLTEPQKKNAPLIYRARRLPSNQQLRKKSAPVRIPPSRINLVLRSHELQQHRLPSLRSPNTFDQRMNNLLRVFNTLRIRP